MIEKNKKYEYPFINNEYKNNDSYITILCNKCGNIFKQTYYHHFSRKQGCPKCNNNVKSLKTLIDNLKKIHNNIYEYPNIENEYKNSKSIISVKCKKCNELFKISINHHLYGKQGCKKCKKVYSYKSYELIDKINLIHNNQYEYPNIENEYINTNSEISIKCKKCDTIFKQSITNHIQGKGCPKCYGNIKLTNNDILSRSLKIHNGKYTYPYLDTEYKNIRSIITIHCKKHNLDFKQNMDNHLNKSQGCPICNESKGEKNIAEYLLKNNIKFERQKKFNECKNKRHLPFDFYLIDYNYCIEYNGKQHYEILDFFGEEKQLTYIKINDELKKDFCYKNNINLFIIKYTENIIIKLNELFQHLKIENKN